MSNNKTISIGRPSIGWGPQFNGKTHNIGWPTNYFSQPDLSVVVRTDSLAVFPILGLFVCVCGGGGGGGATPV